MAQYLAQYFPIYTLMTLPITLSIPCLYNTLMTPSSSTRALSTTLTFLSETLRLKRYFLKNGLLLNQAKTQCIFIGSCQLLSLIPPDTRISFDGDSIHPSTHVKNLGVYLDRYMTFDVHVNELNKKVVGTLMHIYRINLNFERRTRTIVVQSLVFRLGNYCIRIWDTRNATLLNNVQKLQTSQPK